MWLDGKWQIILWRIRFSKWFAHNDPNYKDCHGLLTLFRTYIFTFDFLPILLISRFESKKMRGCNTLQRASVVNHSMESKGCDRSTKDETFFLSSRPYWGSLILQREQSSPHTQKIYSICSRNFRQFTWPVHISFLDCRRVDPMTLSSGGYMVHEYNDVQAPTSVPSATYLRM